jgi:hypothetical protein
VARIYPAFSELFDREGIDEKELLQMVYRMAGEAQPGSDVPGMKRRPLKPFAPKGSPAVTAEDKRLEPDESAASGRTF